MTQQVEVVDPAENEMWPACFGTYDEAFIECTKKCELRDRCKAHKNQVPPKATPIEEEAAIEEFPEMEPKEYLVESLKGRYKVSVKKEGALEIYNCMKDGKPAVQVRVTASGRYLMRCPALGVVLQLDKLESVRQASQLFKALLVV